MPPFLKIKNSIFAIDKYKQTTGRACSTWW